MEIEYVKCPVWGGNPRRWLSYDECMANGIHLGSYEDCDYCEDGYVPVDSQDGMGCNEEDYREIR